MGGVCVSERASGWLLLPCCVRQRRLVFSSDGHGALALALALALGLAGFPGLWALITLTRSGAGRTRAGKWQGTKMPHVSRKYLSSLPIHSVRPGVHRNRCCT